VPFLPFWIAFNGGIVAHPEEFDDQEALPFVRPRDKSGSHINRGILWIACSSCSRSSPMSDTPVGIDLGTSNSVVTVVLEGEPIVIPDEEGHRIHPSVVHLGEDGQTRVGHEATEYRINDPKHTVYSVKRLIGRPFDLLALPEAAPAEAMILPDVPE